MELAGEREKLNNAAESGSGKRMCNLDILRCIAMMMVVVLHFLGKGGLLGDVTEGGMSAAGIAAWILEALCIVAVNVYMLISGYFLSGSSFRPGRLIRLYLQIWFYSVGIGLLAVILGILPKGEADTHYFLSLLFPVSMGHYWFMTAYVFLYLLLPFLGAAVKNMTKQQFAAALILLLAVFCGLKSILPFRLEEDGLGYDCIWYVCVFLTAAYIRRFGLRFLENKMRCACLYLCGCAALLLELFALRLAYLGTGSFGRILKVSFEYNHAFAFLAALGLFGYFLQREKEAGVQTGTGVVGRMAGKAAPYVLGVYLLHENLGLRYGWQRWFGAEKIRSVPGLLLGTAAAVICIFITGVILDWVRENLVKGIHGLLLRLEGYRKLTAGVERVDESFKNKQK